MRFLLFVLIVFWFILGLSSCKKDSPETIQPEPTPKPYYNCRVLINDIRDELGNFVKFDTHIKMLVTDSIGDTVYTDYYSASKTDITFPLTIGTYTIAIFDTTENWAPYYINHKVYPPRGGEPNMYTIGMTKQPKYKLKVVSTIDTTAIINRFTKERYIILNLVSTDTVNKSYFIARIFKKPQSYPINDPSILTGFYSYIENGKGHVSLSLLDASHEFIAKGDTFYVVLVEAANSWYFCSKTEGFGNRVYYNATGKSVQNFQFVN
ncbi:MAG: hypothetical protein ACO1PI_04475 [Bacteroidota bacterium]